MAELGSVSAAASRMSVTQPAVSKQISRLESELSMKLFNRTPRGLRLTPEGETLLELGGDILTRFTRVEVTMRARFAGKPLFRVACPPTTAFLLVTPFLADTNPSIVDLLIVPAPNVDDMLDGQADLSISTLPPPAHRKWMIVGTLPITVQGSVNAMQATFGDSDAGDLERLGSSWALVPVTGVHTVIDKATINFNPPLRVRNVVMGFAGQAMAANDHGFALVTEKPAFGLRDLPAYAGGRLLASTLYASWSTQHYASSELEYLANTFKRWLAVTPVGALNRHFDRS